MCHFRRDVLKREEIVGHLRRPSHFTGPLKAQDKQVKHQAVVLDNERGKLQATDDAVRVGVIHVLHTDTQHQLLQQIIIMKHCLHNNCLAYTFLLSLQSFTSRHSMMCLDDNDPIFIYLNEPSIFCTFVCLFTEPPYLLPFFLANEITRTLQQQTHTFPHRMHQTRAIDVVRKWSQMVVSKSDTYK